MCAGLAYYDEVAHTRDMPFDPDDFLARVLAKAGTQAAICRVLDLPSSRVTMFFKPKGTKNKRRLTMEEGVALARAFDIPLDERVSAERLLPVLRVVLRHLPKRELADADFQRLAQEIAYGLELLQAVGTDQPNPEALDVAARALRDRFPNARD